ncbi:MAG TPA: hypothetical protein VM537_29030 [Anaerolineae bacterium]|nr:hypothetical protein [Anaerolineae bacterium]
MTPQLQLALGQRQPVERDVSRTYVVEYQGNRPARPHYYHGPASEAPLVAQRWLDSDPSAVRIVTENGDVIAEQ